MSRIYNTQDIALAGYLVMRGYALHGITKPAGLGKWQHFEFVSDERLDGHIQDYFDGGQIGARDYAATISRLKQTMYSQRGDSEYDRHPARH